mmetsp:Transcript_40150/g.110559  ORF Transcript_40150/g.110559 Transcript_40150/m.110559 type:complete len:301 (-) Transcript_40150:65-967(-)
MVLVRLAAACLSRPMPCLAGERGRRRGVEHPGRRARRALRRRRRLPTGGASALDRDRAAGARGAALAGPARVARGDDVCVAPARARLRRCGAAAGRRAAGCRIARVGRVPAAGHADARGCRARRARVAHAARLALCRLPRLGPQGPPEVPSARPLWLRQRGGGPDRRARAARVAADRRPLQLGRPARAQGRAHRPRRLPLLRGLLRLRHGARRARRRGAAVDRVARGCGHGGGPRPAHARRGVAARRANAGRAARRGHAVGRGRRAAGAVGRRGGGGRAGGAVHVSGVRNVCAFCGLLSR